MARCGWVLVSCVVLLVSGRSANASVLHVENNGTDSLTCGANQSPCRSISQAIANAGEGDTIRVGPGRYGDANFDGFLDDPGDETGEAGFGCFCVVKIAKAVRIEATHGAGMTVIDAPVGVQVQQVVQITASNAVFGRLNRGFLINPFRTSGIQIVAATNVTVSGNAIVGASGRGGIRVEGSGHTIVANVITHSAPGFSVFGTQSVIAGNVVEAGSVGELGGSGHIVEGNAFVANASDGLRVEGQSHLVRRNAFLGNLVGIQVDVGALDVTITENNIFGNTVCGVFNVSGSVTDASNNFWGDALGPGPDPADEICDLLGSVTVWQPPATKMFQINVP